MQGDVDGCVGWQRIERSGWFKRCQLMSGPTEQQRVGVQGRQQSAQQQLQRNEQDAGHVVIKAQMCILLLGHRELHSLLRQQVIT